MGPAVVRPPGFRTRRLPVLEQRQERVGPALERIRIARLDVGIVGVPLDELRALARVLLREQARDRLRGREVRIAVVEVAVGEGEVHRLVQRVDVARGVVAHRLQVHRLQDVQRLQHHRALHPGVQLVDVDVLVARLHRLLDVDLPRREVLHRDEPALLARAAHELLRDVALVEAVVGGVERGLAVEPLRARRLLRLHELAQRGREIGLAEDRARLRARGRRAAASPPSSTATR